MTSADQTDSPDFVVGLSVSERLRTAERDIDEEDREETALRNRDQDNQPQQEDEEDLESQEFAVHVATMDRFRKTLYYGGQSDMDMPSSDRFSMAVTEICVEAFAKRSPFDVDDGLDRLDLSRASHMTKSTCASPTSLVLALLYLDRLRNKNPNYLHSVSSTDLFLVSLMVASKYLQDDGEVDEVFISDWASAGGMEKKDINRKEMEFLAAIDWSLYISDEEYRQMRTKLEVEVASRQVARRGGWMTSTDFWVLVNRKLKIWKIIMDCSLKVTIVCATAYCASVMTMVGTVFLLNKTPLGPSSVQSTIRSLSRPTSADTSPTGVTTTTPSSSEWSDLVDSVTSDLTSMEEDDGMPTSLVNSSASIEVQRSAKERIAYYNEKAEQYNNPLWNSITDPYDLDPGEADLPSTSAIHHSTSVALLPHQVVDVSQLMDLFGTWNQGLMGGGVQQCPWRSFFMTHSSLISGLA